MKIGIDLDNTVVRYDSLFSKVALKEGLLKEGWSASTKTEIRNYLYRKAEGKKAWMKLQGLVYGKYMQGADMMPGVANFLMSCNFRNHIVFIVSHKTEYGHFDLEKISLRCEALKWMEVKRFFDSSYFGIKKENVFFADTREEKVNMIALLNCDWFVDDLPEVFDEKHFPPSTKKILFGTQDPDKYQDRMVLNLWRKISEQTIGSITDQDVAFWLKGMVKNSVEHVEKIPGRGNSTVYQIHVSGGKSFALKRYPDRLVDNRPRLETEFQTLRMLHEYGLKNVPRPIDRNNDLNLGLYEWISGENVKNPTGNDLDQAISFTEKLIALSKQIESNTVNIASEACLSAEELVHQIEKRFLRLQEAGKNFHELSLFLQEVFISLWEKTIDEIVPSWPTESRHKILPQEKQTLSPSDFGFHNCIKVNDGSFIFIDFDYFGWDDPVKLTADFIWHPAMNLNIKLKEQWKAAMLQLFSNDPCFEERLNAAMPIYGLRWALIVLNEFLPEVAHKRRAADGSKGYNLEKRQKSQLKKANHYCQQVKNMVSQYSFA